MIKRLKSIKKCMCSTDINLLICANIFCLMYFFLLLFLCKYEVGYYLWVICFGTIWKFTKLLKPRGNLQNLGEATICLLLPEIVMFHSLPLKPDFTTPKQNYVSPGSKNKPDSLFDFCHPPHISFIANQKKSQYAIKLCLRNLRWTQWQRSCTLFTSGLRSYKAEWFMIFIHIKVYHAV